MKKNYYFGALAFGLMFATSCANEENNIAPSSDDAIVSFSLGVNGKMGTRANAGQTVDMLTYALFDADGKLLANIGNDGMVVKENAFSGNASESISVSLVKGQTYTIAFWAQNADCEAYTVTTQPNGLFVDVDYNGTNNDEARDAYFASETFTVEGDAVIDVIMKRPFAQVNLGVTMEDWETALASGINVTQSKAVIKNAATTINLFDGSVSGETEVVYDFANIPGETATRAADGSSYLEVNDKQYKWLSMSYILTDEQKSTLDADGLQFTLATSTGENIVFEEGLHNVPVQRNWRTNIVGNVLTGTTTFNVVTDSEYYSVANVHNVEEFKAALKDINTPVIVLAPGEYDVNCVITKKGNTTIKSANPDDKAVIKGVLGLGAYANVSFENLKFDVSEKSLEKTGHQYLDRYERRSIVPVYAAEASFEGCDFVNLYDSRSVVAINYNAHIPGKLLKVNNCTFQGYAYTIYSRAVVSVTNSTFDQFHSEVNPRAIFLYGLGDGTKGTVIFKNNKAIGKTSYTMQLSSTTQPYGAIEFDVQGNENFKVDGKAFLVKEDLIDKTQITYAEGSEELF